MPMYEPRFYQRPVHEAIQSGIKELLTCWARRGGKDFVALDVVAMEAAQRPASYWYALPQQNQVRKAVWDSVNAHTGMRTIDMHFPKELVKNRKQQEMMLELSNGSTVQFIGSDNPDALVGSGIGGVVNSEASLANPRFMDYIRPMLAESGGWELQNSTPRGRNHFYDEYIRMKNDPLCFTSLLTVDDMGHISPEALAREKAKKSEGLFLQEYYCSFDYGLEGAIYLHEMADMAKEGRYCSVPYDPSQSVFVAWDIGFRDATSLVYFQLGMGGEIRVIDHDQANGQKLKHYVDLIKAKPYTYTMQFLPHDGGNKTVAADSISMQLDQLGLSNMVLPRDIDVRIGIERTAVGLANVLMDETKCHHLHAALSAYRYEYDDKLNRMKDKPLHDWASDGSDSIRYAIHAVKLGYCNQGWGTVLDYTNVDRGNRL